jgi:4-oxalocrotonate tautomerase family enzyme
MQDVRHQDRNDAASPTIARKTMPLVQISVVKGREREIVKECVRRVARTVSEALDAPLSTVRVIVNEIEADYWATGDKLKSET